MSKGRDVFFNPWGCRRLGGEKSYNLNDQESMQAAGAELQSVPHGIDYPARKANLKETAQSNGTPDTVMRLHSSRGEARPVPREQNRLSDIR